MSDMNLPGKFHLDKKKGLVLLGGAGLVGAYVFFKHRSASAAVPVAADTTVDDGSDTPIDETGSLDDGSFGDAFGGASGGGVISTPVLPVDPTVPVGTTAFSNNAQWAAQAESDLGQEGFNPLTVAAALGKYLTGGALTASQETIVQAAIQAEGQPPQPVPPMHVAPPSGQTTKTVTANGKQTLWQIAHANGITEMHLIQLNPHLGIYYGTKKNIPKGTKVKV